jgi:Zn-dependent protease
MSVPSEAQPLPAASPAEPAAPNAELLVMRAAFLAPERVKPNALLLLGTLVLYALSARSGERTWVDVVLLIGVLLFHELGHWLGMRAFGFQNVRMFFIPFFGAAVSGRNTSASSWKEALVLLMGPLPGLLLGCVLLSIGGGLLTDAGRLLVLLNGFNLLPVVPFDGGRFFQLLVFSRHRYLENGFTLLAALLLLAAAFGLGDVLLGVLGAFLLLSLPRQVTLLFWAHDLRTSHGMTCPPEELDDTSLQVLHAVAGKLAPPHPEFPLRIRLMRELHDRARQSPPSLPACLGLGGLWCAGMLALLVGLVLAFYVPRSTPWQRHEDPARGFSILLPGKPVSDAPPLALVPPELGLQPSTVAARLDGRFLYSVTVADVPEALRASDGARERLFDGVRDTYGQRRVTLMHESTREVGGQPGRSLFFSSADATGGEVQGEHQLQLGLVNGRLYVLSAERDARFRVSKDAQRFFESFQPMP